MLVDLNPVDITGKVAAEVLDKALITVNKNGIPFDTRSPFVASGIRLGTPAVTSRGMKEAEMVKIAAWISEILGNVEDESITERVKREAVALTQSFPIP
jgi:glycine hydroxymethyltransferase